MNSTDLTEMILNDPLVIAAALALAVGVIVLIWAIVKLVKGNSTDEETVIAEDESQPEPTPPPSTPEEPALPSPPLPEPPRSEMPDLTQQIVERFNQLTERVYSMEKRDLGDITSKLEMIANRLFTLEKVVQESSQKPRVASAAPPPEDSTPVTEEMEKYIRHMLSELEGLTRTQGILKTKLNDISERLDAMESEIKTLKELKKS